MLRLRTLVALAVAAAAIGGGAAWAAGGGSSKAPSPRTPVAKTPKTMPRATHHCHNMGRPGTGASFADPTDL
jgi:hypothetical protein